MYVSHRSSSKRSVQTYPCLTLHQQRLLRQPPRARELVAQVLPLQQCPGRHPQHRVFLVVKCSRPEKEQPFRDCPLQMRLKFGKRQCHRNRLSVFHAEHILCRPVRGRTIVTKWLCGTVLYLVFLKCFPNYSRQNVRQDVWILRFVILGLLCQALPTPLLQLN